MINRTFLALALVASCSNVTEGGIVSLSNGTASWTQLVSPANFTEGVNESDTELFIFVEQADFTLASPLTVDALGDGTYGSDPGNFNLPAGTILDSFLIHMDTLDAGTINHSGLSITFDAPVLGIIGTDGLLNTSDGIVGDPGSTYVTSRGTWEGGDTFTISGNTFTIDAIRAGDGFLDEVRVLVVPEPSSYALLAVLGASLAGVNFFRRRRRTADMAN